MQRLHYCFVALILWFVGLCNIERFHEPINLSGIFYLLTPGFAVLLLLWQSLERLSLPRVLFLSISVFLILKLALGYRVVGARLPVTITEMVAIGITVALCRHIGQGLHEFRGAVFDVMCSQLNNSSRPFETNQAEMYREVRRARVYRRPLALVAVSPASHIQHAPLNRFVEEVQRESMKNYVAARIAHLLTEQTKDCDIIAQRNDHFLILLPEMAPAEAATLLERIERLAREQLGIDLKIGLATFPDQEVTFEGLVERAEATLDDTPLREPAGRVAAPLEVISREGRENSAADCDVGTCAVISLQAAEVRQGSAASSVTSSALQTDGLPQ